MKNMIVRFVKDEQGQDLLEYSLVVAFIALTSAAIFINAGGSVNSIWQSTNTLVSSAVVAAS